MASIRQRGCKNIVSKGASVSSPATNCRALGLHWRRARPSACPMMLTRSGPKPKHAPKAENRRVKLDPFAVAAIRLLILTGARLREILRRAMVTGRF